MPIPWIAVGLGALAYAAHQSMKNAALAEMTASATAARQGLDNEPETPEEERALLEVHRRVVRPLRQLYPDLRVTSGHRSDEVNVAVGGVQGSEHRTGWAVDVKSQVPPMVLWGALQGLWDTTGDTWDQVVVYAPERGGHLHVDLNGNRRQVLFAPEEGGFTPTPGAEFGREPT